jgi:hypothetical protein
MPKPQITVAKQTDLPDVLVDRNGMCALHGGCSLMTLHRRRQAPDFPTPIVISERPHWWLSEVMAHLESKRKNNHGVVRATKTAKTEVGEV